MPITICANPNCENYTKRRGRKYCSHSCAAIINNSIYIKNPEGKNGASKLTKEDAAVFVKDSSYNKGRLKRRIYKYKLLPLVCNFCGIHMWQDKPLVLQMHHINGINTDNRLENLQLLCPNCHSQTDNFCGKNIKCRNLTSP